MIYAMREEYEEWAAENRACGQEVISFEKWAGYSAPRQEAEAHYHRLEELEQLDLY